MVISKKCNPIVIFILFKINCFFIRSKLKVLILFHIYFLTDIQFWKKNKSMKGLSAKSVVVNFICQIVIFLYLLDNDTSWMILLSTAAGCCIEFWKIGKAMHIKVCIS